MNDLITKLRKLNIDISLSEGKLIVRSKAGTVSKVLLEEIKNNKAVIVEYLNSIHGKNKFRPIARTEHKQYYTVSSAQRRLYFLYILNPDSLVYNIPQVLKMKGVLDRGRLSEAFHQLIGRHESLRTFFDLINDTPVQKLQETFKPGIEYFQEDERVAAAVIGQFIRPFDLHQGPLVRMGLLQTGADEYLLLTDMHHIITDGISFSILIRDFMALYNKEELPPLQLQYKDFAEWQQGKEGQSLITKHRSFWLKEFAEPAMTLDLPVDYPRPLVKTFTGNTIHFTLGAEETEKLRAMAAQEGATLFMILLSVYSMLLGRLCNQEDIVIGTPSSGRQHADLENIIGMFVNTLCLRNYPRGRLPFREYLQEVKVTTLSCFDNQEYQYENLLEDLKMARDTSRNPLFETMFVFHNFGISQLSIPGVTLKPWQMEQGISKFDLSLSATEQDGELLLNFEYSANLFQPDTIQRFIHYFKKLVTTVIANPMIRLEDMIWLPAVEKRPLPASEKRPLPTGHRHPLTAPEKRPAAPSSPGPASNNIRERLVTIWADVLKVNRNKIGLDANFFESGGHSINIIALCRKINEEFNCTISVAEMFGLPTIASIESFISQPGRPSENKDNSIAEAINEANNNLNLLNEIMN